MKIKISEATPVQLDWMVAKCEGIEVKIPDVPKKFFCYLLGIVHDDAVAYHPTTSWAQGGPIIEREDIFPSRYYGAAESRGKAYQASVGGWWMHGSSPLIAAMRCYCASKLCYCASKLGDEVEVPEELK